jgi:hypothetical protein
MVCTGSWGWVEEGTFNHQDTKDTKTSPKRGGGGCL